MLNIIYTILSLLFSISVRFSNTEHVLNFLIKEVKKISLSKTPTESLRFLLELNNRLYDFTGRESVRYGNGVHTKHKHIKYHDFFIKNIKPKEKVLDIGCGNGNMDYDIARKVEDVHIIGVDFNQTNIMFAKENYAHSGLTFLVGDALKNLPEEGYSIVILSNVLEHIENRIDFLKKIKKTISPEKILLRVPLFERDWRVPLMKELGIDYRLDSTHFVEYLLENLVNELTDAGYGIVEKEIKWGEAWAVVEPV